MQLVEKFKNDKRADKMNLTVGVYKDESGQSPILKSVKEAEKYCLETETTKASFNLIGSQTFHEAVKRLLFPSFSESEKKKIQVIQTVGSCGALYLVGQLINKIVPSARIWISNPTWENHWSLLHSHINEIYGYRYEPLNRKCLDIEKIMEDLKSSQSGDFVLFHASCHNPTGMDPTIKQWHELANFCKSNKLIPVFDFAYQGFKDTIQNDADIFKVFRQMDSFIVCNSFSKNMGLYDERAGALSFMCKDIEKLSYWVKCAKKFIRGNYSTPPMHGSSIVSCIINDPERYQSWQKEVDEMRESLIQRRNELFQALERIGIKGTILNYERQNGMFVCLDLSLSQIEQLRNDYGIYLLNSGRISVASLNSKKIIKLCTALQNILRI
jgi:aspartate/tyrosine/aromatic aminotransferase